MPHFRGISDAHGRMMVLMTHNTDISDAWEREGEDPRVLLPVLPNGYAVGLDVVLYGMTHYRIQLRRNTAGTSKSYPRKL